MGLEIFVYGKSAGIPLAHEPKKFPARQSLEASQVVAAAHQLPSERVLLVQQNPAVIDRGVFHNDLIATSNENVFLFHEQAFVDMPSVIQEIKNRYAALTPQKLYCFQIDESILSIPEALRSFFFNSQIVTLPDGTMALIASEECRNPPHAPLFDFLMGDDSPIRERHFVDLSESLHNGGGPACLRLRVVLTEAEARCVNSAFLFDEEKGNRLESWIRQYYRDELAIEDLQDFQLVEETRRALEALTRMFGMGSFYSFQAGQ